MGTDTVHEDGEEEGLPVEREVREYALLCAHTALQVALWQYSR